LPGTFAHITLADTLARDADALDGIASLTTDMKYALTTSTRFCHLGAVSPDYPYLTCVHPDAKAWADVMHYWKAADFIRNGVRHLSDNSTEPQDPLDREKCIAWLFGYTTHVVADLTIHPVIEQRVGPYEKNPTEHRVCELHQDTYIVSSTNREEIGTPEYSVTDSIAACSEPQDESRLFPAVAALWERILADFPLRTIDLKNGLGSPTAPPNPYEWHRWYVEIVRAASEGRHLPALSRHFAEDKGVAYPPYAELDRSYIDPLITPAGASTTYDEVFRQAQENVRRAWAELGEALTAKDPQRFTLPNGDLDNGLEEPQSIYWRA
jgi:hypothetical protein